MWLSRGKIGKGGGQQAQGQVRGLVDAPDPVGHGVAVEAEASGDGYNRAAVPSQAFGEVGLAGGLWSHGISLTHRCVRCKEGPVSGQGFFIGNPIFISRIFRSGNIIRLESCLAFLNCSSIISVFSSSVLRI